MSKLPKPKQPIRRGKKANGYQFPEELPQGEVLKDITKKEWVLGPTIGKGGFGQIYSARKNNGEENNAYPFAVKIEPHDNGPLFMEKNFYIKIAKPEDVEDWKNARNIKVLGIPTCCGTGTHYFKDQKYRFMVMERYGQDLWSLFLKNKRKFPPATVYRCALQIIDILNYIHDKEFVHGDIKGANILLGLKSGTQNNIFLVDFGLACRYTTKEFKRDPKQAHNGTIEYTSCDWHEGVPTRRGDLEILGYNLLQWLSSSLPWEQDIKNKEKVYEKKKKLMTDVRDFFSKHFPNLPKVILEYFEYVSKLNYNESPNYQYCRDLFTKELKRLKAPIHGKMEFKTSTKQTADELNIESEEEEEVIPKKRSRIVNKKQKETLKKSSSKETQVIKTPRKNGTVSNNSSPAYKTPKNIPVESDEDIFFTPDEIKPAVKSPKKNVTPKRKPGQIKKPASSQISWRDAPTIRAGNTENKAGVYTRKRVI